MKTTERPIVVGMDGSPGSEAALRWAMGEAHVRTAPVRLVHAYHAEAASRLGYAYYPAFDIESYAKTAGQLIASALDRARALAPGVDVEGITAEAHPRTLLLEGSEHAALVVLGSRHLKAIGSSILGSVSAGVAARARCPAVVLRGPAGVADEQAAVVVGVAPPEPAFDVLCFAFDHADRHRAPLRAVLCWHPDLLAAMSWRAEPTPPAAVGEALAGYLEPWRQKYPQVVVHADLVREHATDGLVFASHTQRLPVVGSHGRHALTGTVLGSVSQGVLHHATCQVAVIPCHSE